MNTENGAFFTMLDAQQWVVDALKLRTLPDDLSPFLDLIKNKDLATFEIQENTYWDYKDQFPHSLTDDYFWGICRLICGFHNRYGGFIIFGVHDKTRTAGHNRVHVDIERLNARLRTVLNVPVECVHRRYKLGTGKPVPSNKHDDDTFDILLVPKRAFSTAVVRFRVDAGPYKAAEIFVRENHEVIRATSADITELYTPRSDYGLLQGDTAKPIPSVLPQRPSFIRQFVGRTRVLDQLFTWFITKDETRTFLHGRGGSGKSTIAYEFASIISNHGGDIDIQGGGGKLDRVIYLTAKEQELDTRTRKIRKHLGTDFADADELFRDILLLSEWSSIERIDALTPENVRDELRQLLDLQSLLIIIDDIDTLYSKGIDDGSEFLVTVLARAKLRSKILYTMRQMPSLSISAAIEVTGLQIGGEYEEFIATCAAQLQIPAPGTDLISGRLREISEGIPLVLETILQLRKSSSSYETAIIEFQSIGGSDVRRYLFSKEYNALRNNQPKLLLAALALFENPASFEELQYAP
jgi:dephospho-CoA kinase